MRLIHSTKLGQLYQADCIDLLGGLDDGCVHTLFADPPFNLQKYYGRNGSDNLSESEYLVWTKDWLADAVRVLAPGGALFVYNLPKWLIEIGAFLNSFDALTFKHWIAIERPGSLPIPKRLSPSHYGMLYYVKGAAPRVFNRDAVRTPMQRCRHCHREIKDYGGHRKYLNPRGLNLTDVWHDVPPVRHRKYKSRAANELPASILERVILLTTSAGDLFCDPFVGGGVSAYVAEGLGRRWIAGDLNDCTAARRRLTQGGSLPISSRSRSALGASPEGDARVLRG